jgi:hypothetical protein
MARDDDGLGARFWLWLAAVLVLGGLALLVLLLIFSRAVYAFGFFGGFLVLALLALLFGWFWDKREARRYAGESDPL